MSSFPPLPPQYVRKECNYEDTSSCYSPTERHYSQQYCSLYFIRLAALKGVVREEALRRWEADIINEQVVVAEHTRDAKLQKNSILVGTLYKDMRLKPSVLKEYSEEVQLQAELKSLRSDDDYLILEDHSGRFRLKSEAMNPQRFVSGLIVAVYGRLDTDGSFHVVDYCYGGIPRTLSTPSRNNGDSDALYVGFVSGLKIGDASMNPIYLKLLKSFLLGCFGGEQERKLSSNIVRLIVCGNALSAVNDDMSALPEVDAYFSEIAPFIPVDVMPGAADPTTYSLPQKPLHPVLFQHSRRLSTFKSTTNPYSFTVNQTRFLGTSGQAIDNICAFSELSPLEALELTAKARCIAPTAPDTLPCYPFVDSDPFCIADDRSYPHVLFCGNQGKHESKRVGPNQLVRAYGSPELFKDYQSDVCLITVSDFSKLPALTLVEIHTLEVVIINFQTLC